MLGASPGISQPVVLTNMAVKMIARASESATAKIMLFALCDIALLPSR